MKGELEEVREWEEKKLGVLYPRLAELFPRMTRPTTYPPAGPRPVEVRVIPELREVEAVIRTGEREVSAEALEEAIKLLRGAGYREITVVAASGGIEIVARKPIKEIPVPRVPRLELPEVRRRKEVPVPSVPRISPPTPRPKQMYTKLICPFCRAEFSSVEEWKKHIEECKRRVSPFT